MKDGHGNRIPPADEAETRRRSPPVETAATIGSGPASERVAKIARAHGVSVGAVEAALRALRQGGGTMAQLSHPDFGGMAQWSAGGMSMVGDMFNATMKARLDGVMGDLAEALRAGDLASDEPSGARSGDLPRLGDWPAEFGSAAASGSQNDMRYAFFPVARRLVVDDGGRRTIHDTGDHAISGVSQQQGSERTLTFQSQRGPVRLTDLPVVG